MFKNDEYTSSQVSGPISFAWFFMIVNNVVPKVHVSIRLKIDFVLKNCIANNKKRI